MQRTSEKSKKATFEAAALIKETNRQYCRSGQHNTTSLPPFSFLLYPFLFPKSIPFSFIARISPRLLFVFVFFVTLSIVMSMCCFLELSLHNSFTFSLSFSLQLSLVTPLFHPLFLFLCLSFVLLDDSVLLLSFSIFSLFS